MQSEHLRNNGSKKMRDGRGAAEKPEKRDKSEAFYVLGKFLRSLGNSRNIRKRVNEKGKRAAGSWLRAHSGGGFSRGVSCKTGELKRIHDQRVRQIKIY